MASTEISKKTEISYRYADEKALDMLRQELSEGKMPESENEIVLDTGAVEKLGKSVELGSKVNFTIPGVPQWCKRLYTGKGIYCNRLFK